MPTRYDEAGKQYLRDWRKRNADRWRKYARTWKTDRKLLVLAAKSVGATTIDL